jgi:fructokinase
LALFDRIRRIIKLAFPVCVNYIRWNKIDINTLCSKSTLGEFSLPAGRDSISQVGGYRHVKCSPIEESQANPMTQHMHPRRSPSPLSTTRKRTVVLFGEVLADIFADRTVLGGAPFNVARHLKAFGQNPVLITRLGHDALADEVLDVMSKNEMEILGVQCDNNYPTGRVQVHMQGGAHSFEILPAQAYDFIHPGVVRMTVLSANPKLVYFGTLAQRNEISRRALKSLLRSTSATKFLDINLRAPWFDEKILKQSLQYADTVKLNAEELAILAEMFGFPDNQPQGLAMDLMNQFGLEQVVVTCGQEGAWQLDRKGKKVEAGVKDRIIRLMDTVGAGDGFAAVCILGELLRWPATQTLERANAFASAICEIRGAIPDHADFYHPFTHEWDK